MSLKSIEDLTLSIKLEMRVHASLETTFAALLDQLGPRNETPEGRNLAMVLEPWPGGRWFRDLGGQNGHFWGNVQAIKRPGLLELSGPLFASAPLFSNLQYRLNEIPEGTLITLRHSALGFVLDGDQVSAAGPLHRDGIESGWKHTLERTRQQAESAAPMPQKAGSRPGANGR
jgi:hypothetical protein